MSKHFLRQLISTAFCVVLLASFTNAAQATATDATTQAAEGGNIQIKSVSKAAREYHLKAAFLRYVAKFVEWPDNALPADRLNLCVIGQVPYFRGIDSINGKVVNDRELKIVKISDTSEITAECHMVYIAKTEAKDIDKIIKAIQDKPILGFGDMDHFAEKGGNMNFKIVDNRLAIMINPPSVERSQLKINPRMLKLVTVVPNVG